MDAIWQLLHSSADACQRRRQADLHALISPTKIGRVKTVAPPYTIHALHLQSHIEFFLQIWRDVFFALVWHDDDTRYSICPSSCHTTKARDTASLPTITHRVSSCFLFFDYYLIMWDDVLYLKSASPQCFRSLNFEKRAKSKHRAPAIAIHVQFCQTIRQVFVDFRDLSLQDTSLNMLWGLDPWPLDPAGHPKKKMQRNIYKENKGR